MELLLGAGSTVSVLVVDKLDDQIEDAEDRFDWLPVGTELGVVGAVPFAGIV